MQWILELIKGILCFRVDEGMMPRWMGKGADVQEADEAGDALGCFELLVQYEKSEKRRSRLFSFFSPILSC